MSCEDDLARARLELEDVRQYLAATTAEIDRLAATLMALQQQAGISPTTGTGSGAVSSVAETEAARSTADEGGATTTTESRAGTTATPAILLTRRAAALAERLARLEAKT